MRDTVFSAEAIESSHVARRAEAVLPDLFLDERKHVKRTAENRRKHLQNSLAKHVRLTAGQAVKLDGKRVLDDSHKVFQAFKFHR